MLGFLFNMFLFMLQMLGLFICTIGAFTIMVYIIIVTFAIVRGIIDTIRHRLKK